MQSNVSLPVISKAAQQAGRAPMLRVSRLALKNLIKTEYTRIAYATCWA